MNVHRTLPNDYSAYPDAKGRFGDYGGLYVAETLMPLVLELGRAYAQAKADPAFQAELAGDLTHYVGRPSALYFAERMTDHFGGAKIYLKREELNHTGSHKINNCSGQILLAKRMGKTRIIAETGCGARVHGVAVRHRLRPLRPAPCVVYMGATDVERQAPNVLRMNLLGAEVRPVTSGTGTLKDAMNEALRDWVTNVHDTYYLIGSVAGPHPYPVMVRDFQRVIGVEARAQILEAEGRLPDAVVACVGGGSNAIGLFHPFLTDERVRLIGVEAAGHGLASGQHAASLTGGRPGVLHGNKTYLLQDDDGQIKDAHSISAGLDYPGIGPEHAFLNDIGRAQYLSATDDDALAAFQLCAAWLEGIIPALESAHAVARLGEIARDVGKDGVVVLLMSGRGDKDLRYGGRAHGARRVDRRPYRRSVRRAESPRPRGLCGLYHGRRSRRRDCPGDPQRLSADGGRRHHRTGLSLLRSTWPRDRRSSGRRSGLCSAA